MARVMIVDDAKVMRIHLGNMLRKLGHDVIAEAENGHGAVELYKHHQPDFVTMDITMPFETSTRDVAQVKDGIEAVRQIVLEYPDAKIIMVTSHGEQDKVIRAIQSGASNYLLKPIDIKNLKRFSQSSYKIQHKNDTLKKNSITIAFLKENNSRISNIKKIFIIRIK